MDVDEPMLVDVVDVPPLLVDVVPGTLVDVEDDDEDESSSGIVAVVSAVVGDDDDVGVVALVDVGDPASDVTVACDEFVSSDVLIASVAVVTDVDVLSSALAQATPTTASAAIIDVTIPTIFLTIQCLLSR